MKAGWRENVALSMGVIGTLVAVLGVYKFFDDRDRARALEARAQALSYVEKYGSENLRARRQDLFEFWLRNADVVAHINEEGSTDRAYRAFLTTAFENYPEKKTLVSSLHALSSFYDEASFCREAGICDTLIFRSYFCAPATDFVRTYAPLSEALGEMSGETNFGAGARRTAQWCAAQR